MLPCGKWHRSYSGVFFLCLFFFVGQCSSLLLTSLCITFWDGLNIVCYCYFLLQHNLVEDPGYTCHLQKVFEITSLGITRFFGDQVPYYNTTVFSTCVTVW